MSEKRFIEDDWYLVDTETNETIGYNISSQVIDLLNSLNEQAEYWEDKYKRREFDIENELNRTQKLIFSLMDAITEKEKENEQLREEVKLKEQEIRSLMRYRVV